MANDTAFTVGPVEEQTSSYRSEESPDPRLSGRLSNETCNIHGQDTPANTLPDGYHRHEGREDAEISQQASGGPVYCAFSRATKLWIVTMITVSSFISPLSLNVYFPALSPIAHELGASVSLINLSVTSFQIMQAVAPMFVGDFGDTAGRRPAFIVCFVIYLVASVGLALQTTYPALMVLRCLQSLGISGTLAQCYAVVADISTTAERGKYMGIAGIGMMAGPGLGLLLGGILTQFLTWRSVFWFCFIVAAVWLVPYVLLVPETCRNVVGNGSIPPIGWNRTLLDWMRSRRSQPESHDGSLGAGKMLYLPNPLRTLAICLQKDMSMLLLFNAILFASIFMALTILSTSFVELYGLNQLQIGLCYLPYGLACCLTTVVQGRILDWNYHRMAKKIHFTIDRLRGDSLRHYPIELCRLQIASPIIATGVVAMVGYGWALEARTSLVIPLVMLFFIGLCLVGGHSIMNTLIVDLYPQSPATAISANNLTRCLVSAGGSAVVKLLVDAIGHGWCFTLVGGMMVVFSPFLYLLVTRGPKYREERRLKLERDVKKPAGGPVQLMVEAPEVRVVASEKP